MAKPYPTIETQVLNRPGVARRAPPPPPPSLTLSVPFTDIPNDPATAASYTFDVVRAGDAAGTSDATWTVVPAAGSPIPAAYFGGSFPTGAVHLTAGQGRQSCVIRVSAGADLSTDTFADIVLSGFAGARPGPTTTWHIRAPGSVVVTDALVSVSMPVVVLDRDPAVDTAYTVVVTRTGNLTVACSVQVATTGAGANPVTAADFVGGLLAQQVDFAAGDTQKQLTVTVVHGPDPAADLTGVVALSAPVGCKINPAVSSVAVKIPKAVIVGPAVLPPEYLDPNFAGMTAYSPAPTDPVSLLAACAAISGSAQCATTYVELAPTFAGGTGTIALNYNGFVKNPGKASQTIHPLIVCSPRAAIGDRTKLAQLGHFRHLDLNGAKWLWVYGLAIEYPLDTSSPPVQPDLTPAIELDGSMDCFVTRCWLDAPCCLHTQTAVRPRVGGNDLYGTPDTVGNPNWITTFYAQFNGGPHTAVKRTLTAHIYQNFFGMRRAPALEARAGGPVDGSGSFYAGDGVAPDQGFEGTYPDQPYDLNWRESWFFNNLVMTTKDFLIYNKHVCNLYRNRVVSLKNWTDITGTGNAFHLIAARGGNVIGDNAAVKCAFKYNVIEADRTPATHCDIQGWKTTWEFNDFGGNQVNIYMHCGRAGRTASGKVYKTLLAGSYSRFVGNIGGVYVVGNSRADVGYSYYAPVLDCRWEGESGGAWQWEGTDGGVAASPNGTTIVWGPSGKNTETFRLTFPGDTAKVGCAPGQLTRAAGTVKTPELSLAYAGNGFTKAEKGIPSREGLVWDYVGDGGGGGGGRPDGTYGLTQGNMTVHMPSDDMPTDYPHVALTWLPGGGFDLKANNAQSDPPYGHACIYLWHKLAPPLGDVEFNFYATMVDNNPSPTTDGVFSLFSPRARGLAAYGADPNGWASASWRSHPSYPTPGSDFIYRARMLGYRHSFMNTANTVANSMQFRIRTYNGVDDGGTQLDPTVPATVPSSGDSFLFTQGTRYLINVVRAGTVETGTKTDPAGGKQTWTFDDPALGDAGKGVGGWCGFQVALGRHAKIEPVPGVPFCRPYSPLPPPPPGGGDPVNPWWKIPGGNRSGKLWNRGPGLTFAASAWTPKMGAYDVTTGASHRSESTMNEVIGGPVSGTLADYDDVSKIQNGSQLDWGGTTMDSAANSAVPGKTWLIWVPDTNPTGGPYDTTGDVNSTVWATWGAPGPHDDWWYAMGRRARAVMLSYGLQPWQLMLRINHEMNQTNNYQVFYGNGPDYAKAMGRFITGFRAGYTAHSADDYPRMIFSPSRHWDCGPIERFFTGDPVALTTPYDLVDVSAHPAGTMNKYATGYTLAQQVDQVNIWINGGNDAGTRTPDLPDTLATANYAQNCSVADHSMIKLAKKYSIGMCNSEWSPRYDLATCTISAAVHQAMHDWFTANAAWYAFECVFHSNTLNKTVAVANWAAGVDTFINLWTGDPAETHKAAAGVNPGSVHTGKLTLA